MKDRAPASSRPMIMRCLRRWTAPGGGIRYAYISEVHAGDYTAAVMIDRLQYFPEPQPDSIVPGDTLSQIRDFADAELHAKLGAKVMVVNEPGPGVARVKVAITAVSAEKRDLKAYQYIPIALVLTLSKWAITGRPDDSTVAFEGEVTDSVTHARRCSSPFAAEPARRFRKMRKARRKLLSMTSRRSSTSGLKPHRRTSRNTFGRNNSDHQREHPGSLGGAISCTPRATAFQREHKEVAPPDAMASVSPVLANRAQGAATGAGHGRPKAPTIRKSSCGHR